MASREDGSVSLSGPWELYWNRLFEPGDFAEGAPGNALTVTIPAQWKSYENNGQALSNEGYATYRMQFVVSSEVAGQPLGLYFNNVATAYRFWINGERVDGNGTVGTDAKHMVPRSYPKVYFFQPRPGDNEIIIQVSNFAQRTGGIWESIELGDAEDIASPQRNRVMLWTFVTGCFFAHDRLLCLPLPIPQAGACRLVVWTYMSGHLHKVFSAWRIVRVCVVPGAVLGMGSEAGIPVGNRHHYQLSCICE